VSELPLRAPCANPSVRATFASASESLTSDKVVDLCRVIGRIIHCGLDCLKLHAVGGHARDPGHYCAMSRHHCVKRRIADLPCERRDACAQRDELHTGVGRR
jgi:hypothetical protein